MRLIFQVIHIVMIKLSLPLLALSLIFMYIDDAATKGGLL